MENLVQTQTSVIVETATQSKKLQTDIVLASVGVIATIGDIIAAHAEEVAIDRFYEFGQHPNPFIEDKIATELLFQLQAYLTKMRPLPHQMTDEHARAYYTTPSQP